MVRIATLAIALMVLLGALAGCSSSPGVEEAREKDSKVRGLYNSASLSRAIVADVPGCHHKDETERWDNVTEALGEYERLPESVETGEAMAVYNNLWDAIEDWKEVLEQIVKQEGCYVERPNTTSWEDGETHRYLLYRFMVSWGTACSEADEYWDAVGLASFDYIQALDADGENGADVLDNMEDALDKWFEGAQAEGCL